MNHDNEELHNLAYNVIRDIEDAADIDRMVKLIERAMRHYAEYMDKSDKVAELETAAKGVCAIAVSHNYNGDIAMEGEVEKLASLLDWSGKR